MEKREMASNFPPDGHIRLNVNVPVALHQKLKVAAVMTRTTMGDLIQQLIREELDKILRGGIR
jgi:hypothetical protein